MKLWQKTNASLEEVERFTVGRDREMDMYLASFDVIGTMAHTKMLSEIGLISKEEFESIHAELKNIYRHIESGEFYIAEGVEDIHSQVEYLLTEHLGDAGKKVHTARSRNDQVLVDIKLFLRSAIEETVTNITSLFDLFQSKSEEYKSILIPGYTHLQIAMPSSMGLWFGAYAESLVDDLKTVRAAFEIVNKNPLGSAAGYGSSFPINRSRTTLLLGFDTLNYNVVYAQMGRGKTEKVVAQSLSNIAATLAKMSMDACLFMNQNFGFIAFPDELTTGSSIMPHKKNPDVLELVRAHCNKLQALPNEITMMTANLPGGYHRDMQLLKENLFPAFNTLNNCIQMMHLMFSNIQVKENILEDEKYKFLFSVEEVNKLVLAGIPFRDAYKQVGLSIEDGTYKYSTRILHTHEGSIGYLCTDEIKNLFYHEVEKFNFHNVKQALDQLMV